ncbi:M23 family metallopeptidase [Naasia lichenicola]|uniref:M23 family metallopeptidase n=1 Tax=Naasia lichenicola TaxID=2565933 RepID=A0A4S4FKJ9_9MICO|nr:hypothetical protein [Naasia lichenicola]THG30668.1 hypothetical protein E6C64_08490 [Naasia lichenicola]THG31905.1 hypothetical protein E6C64_07635 [Naasia lichenicola]
MIANDFPVTFGYRATDGVFYGPKGSVGKYHRGNDRACPVGTPIVIGGVIIGYTGNTGVTGGPHLHIQAGTDIACQKDIDPTPYEFQPGTVVAVGIGSQWGNYVTVRVGDSYVTYCHLSSVATFVGQELTTSRGGSMISISYEEYEDLKSWKAKGIDATKYKDAVIASEAWNGDMHQSIELITPVMNDLHGFKRDQVAQGIQGSKSQSATTLKPGLYEVVAG